MSLDWIQRSDISGFVESCRADSLVAGRWNRYSITPQKVRDAPLVVFVSRSMKVKQSRKTYDEVILRASRASGDTYKVQSTVVMLSVWYMTVS